MPEDIRVKLNDYYMQIGIHPEKFQCFHQSTCRKFANQGRMTETKMSMVGSLYDKKYPKITVVSLDPPEEKNGVFKTPKQRTTESVSQLHEAEDFYERRPGAHWAITQIIVKDLLVIWGFPSQPGSAVVTESYAGRQIENVSAYFAHVNVAKCSMNNPGRGQSNEYVHQKCSHAYLMGELAVLEPDILISQGADANRILGELLVGSYASSEKSGI